MPKTTVRLSLTDEQIRELKKQAIEEGKTLSDYVTSLSQTRSSERQQLVENFNKVVESLASEMKRHDNQSLSVFLHQSININANEATLRAIIADVEKHLKRLKNKK